MKVCVITPYYKESEAVLQRCRQSVTAQTVRCRHYMIADGFPQGWIDDDSAVVHLKLHVAHGDDGNTPRGLGALLAASDGADAICFLDADNSIDPDHVKTCLDTARRNQGCDVIEARRRFVFPDDVAADIPEEPGHIDTSCYFLLPGSFHLLAHLILQPKILTPLCDRVFLDLLRARGMRFASCDKVTVTYTTNYRAHYDYVGRPAPPGAKEPLPRVTAWWRSLSNRDREIVRRNIGFHIDFPG